MEFYRWEYWSGLPFPPPGHFPYPRTEPAPPVLPTLAGRFFTTELRGGHFTLVQFTSVHSLRLVQLFVTAWTAVCQPSLSITNSQSLLRLMSIEPLVPSNHLILCGLLFLLPSVFPSIRVFSNQLFESGGQSIGVSASASVLPMNIQN